MNVKLAQRYAVYARDIHTTRWKKLTWGKRSFQSAIEDQHKLSFSGSGIKEVKVFAYVNIFLFCFYISLIPIGIILIAGLAYLASQ